MHRHGHRGHRDRGGHHQPCMRTQIRKVAYVPTPPMAQNDEQMETDVFEYTEELAVMNI